jgi:hypothetical protein
LLLRLRLLRLLRLLALRLLLVMLGPVRLLALKLRPARR